MFSLAPLLDILALIQVSMYSFNMENPRSVIYQINNVPKVKGTHNLIASSRLTCIHSFILVVCFLALL